MSTPDSHCGVGEPQHLVLALYVRDAAGLDPVTDPVIPPLRPEVPVQPGLVSDADRAAVTTQWEHWWQHLWTMLDEDVTGVLPVPGQSPDLSKQPELQTVVRTVFGEAQQYCAARRQEHADDRREQSRLPHRGPEAAVLKQATRRRGFRRPRAVHLRVSELPVATMQGWHPHHGHVVVTRALYRDMPAYQRLLQPIAGDLARRRSRAHEKSS